MRLAQAQFPRGAATVTAPVGAAPALEPDPPAASAEPPLLGFRAPGDTRPVSRTFRFDVDTLPVATWGDAAPGAGFSLRPHPRGWSLSVNTTIFAEVIVSASAPYEAGVSSPVGFTAFTGAIFSSFAENVPVCGPREHGKRLAVWGGFAPAGWTDTAMNVEMNEGEYDSSTCRGTPVRSLAGRASAIVPGYVYALRTREDDDSETGREALVVFLPRGAMLAMGADPDLPLEAANSGSFSRLTFPLLRGTARSASLRIGPSSLALWRRLRETRGSLPLPTDATTPHEDLMVGLDVAWQGETRLGSVSIALPATKQPRTYAGFLSAADHGAP